MSCFGCIKRCPQDAIDIRGKSEGRRRYVCPESEPEHRASDGSFPRVKEGGLDYRPATAVERAGT